jgi:aarF domain-containing kinase
MKIMGFLARVVQRLLRTAELANPVAIVEDFDRTIREELDFRLEAQNLDQFNAFFARVGEDELVAPKVFWDYTTERVLTMERFHGFKADDVDAITRLGIDSEHYLRRGLRGWLMIMLCTGFFHGDVHAGNLMFLADKRKIGFLDFGIIGRFTPEQRDQVMRYIITFAGADFRKNAELMVEMGAAPKDIDVDAFAKHLKETYSPILGKALASIKYEEVLPTIVRGAIRFGVRLPREFILVLKQLLYFDRYAKLTAPNLNVWQDFSLVDFLFLPIATECGLDVPKIMESLVKLQAQTAARESASSSSAEA